MHGVRPPKDSSNARMVVAPWGRASYLNYVAPGALDLGQKARVFNKWSNQSKEVVMVSPFVSLWSKKEVNALYHLDIYRFLYRCAPIFAAPRKPGSRRKKKLLPSLSRGGLLRYM